MNSLNAQPTEFSPWDNTDPVRVRQEEMLQALAEGIEHLQDEEIEEVEEEFDYVAFHTNFVNERPSFWKRLRGVFRGE